MYGDERVVTPEAVELALDVAGVGSRGIAIAIDLAIQAILLFGLISLGAATGISGTAANVLIFAVIFVLLWGYFPLFEGFWGGRTPGKRTQRLRVVRIDGQPAGIGVVFVRNLVRIIDFLPSFYGIGVLVMLVNKRSQRLGDLAAGTVVVRERKLDAIAPGALDVHDLPGAAVIDVSALGHQDHALVREFLGRRATLRPEARAQLAASLASALRARVRGDVPGDEAFLEAIAASFRNRFKEPGARTD